MLMLSSLLAMVQACSGSNFTSSSSHKQAAKQDSGSDQLDSGSPVADTVKVTVGGQTPIVNDKVTVVSSCTSEDPDIATVDAKTCVVQGIKAGTTTVDVVLGDGTTQKVTVNVTAASTSPLVTADFQMMTKTPQFGLLVNNLACSFCHLKVNGDVVSTSTVDSLYSGSTGGVNGTWVIDGAFNIGVEKSVNDINGKPYGVGANVDVKVSGGVQQNVASAANMPKDRDGDGKPDFPTIDFSTLDSKMQGSLKAKGVNVQSVYNGNLVVIGTTDAPIQITGEVLVKGDLVIKGPYQGIGNIYATGNIYIPGDILAKTSPFPYSTDREAALKQAKAALAANMDALALATPLSIVISDFETHAPMPDKSENGSVFEHIATPLADQASQLGIKNLYTWFPGGETGYDALYDTFDMHCVNTPDRGQNHRSFSRIDAFLYAAKAIGGRANLNSYSINGGVIANYFHVISGAINCPVGLQPIHKQDQQYSYVNYDWRMQVGLLLLKQFGDDFN